MRVSVVDPSVPLHQVRETGKDLPFLQKVQHQCYQDGQEGSSIKLLLFQRALESTEHSIKGRVEGWYHVEWCNVVEIKRKSKVLRHSTGNLLSCTKHVNG